MRPLLKISTLLAPLGAILSPIPLAKLGSGIAKSQVLSSQSLANEVKGHLLFLYNTHTGERIKIVYRQGEMYIPSALFKLDYFLRDHRTGEVRQFDPRLYDVLSDLTASVGGSGGKIDIVCAYRTRATNE